MLNLGALEYRLLPKQNWRVQNGRSRPNLFGGEMIEERESVAGPTTTPASFTLGCGSKRRAPGRPGGFELGPDGLSLVKT
jgi:hypothetical protein